jgi:hypothetical protein
MPFRLDSLGPVMATPPVSNTCESSPVSGIFLDRHPSTFACFTIADLI